MRNQESLPLGVVLERRKVDNPWQDYAWRPVTVIPGAAPLAPEGTWTQLSEGDGWVHFHAGTLPLELFPRETEGYKLNLSQNPPRIFVVLRSGEDQDCAHDVVPFLVTVCPYEAQDYLDSGEELVEPVIMPEGVVAFVQSYVEAHHVDEVFQKRKRKRYETGDERFAPRPRVDPWVARGRRRRRD